MNSSQLTRNRVTKCFLTITTLALVSSALAQQVIVPLPVSPPQQRAEPAAATNEAPAAVESGMPTEAQPFKWGPVLFHPHVSYDFLYGNGIQSQTNSAHKTIV